MYSYRDSLGDDGKVRRKRVLISSDFRSALKKRQIFDVYQELNQSQWIADVKPDLKLKRFLAKQLGELATKYSDIVYKPAPVIKKKKQVEDDYDSDEEARHKRRAIYQQAKHKYSLFNPNNVHYTKYLNDPSLDKSPSLKKFWTR